MGQTAVSYYLYYSNNSIFAEERGRNVQSSLDREQVRALLLLSGTSFFLNRHSISSSCSTRRSLYFHTQRGPCFWTKPWSQVVSSLIPPGACLPCLSRIGFIILTAARRFSSKFANSRFRTIRRPINRIV